MVFGIGAAVTVLAMGVLLSPSTGTPPWLDIILMLLLTVVMWMALRPFRRLTQMVSNRNHFAEASGGLSSVTGRAARTSGRILTNAIGTFLGVSAAQRAAGDPADARPGAPLVPQRAEADTSYQPILVEEQADETDGSPPPRPAAAEGVPTAARPPQVNAGTATVVDGAGGRTEAPGEIYDPAAARTRTESTTAARTRTESTTAAHIRTESMTAARTRTEAAAAPVTAVADGRPEPEPAARAAGGRFESGGAQGATTGGPTETPADARRGPSGRRRTSAATADEDRRPRTYGTAEDGRPEARASDRGFQPAPGERGADLDLDLDELNEVFRPSPVHRP
jgi:hypothetical protein